MKRLTAIFIMILLLCGLCSCYHFKDTPETDAAFAAYEAAVTQSIAHKKGSITVHTENTDTVVENKSTVGIIEYTFETDDAGRVTFERNDYTDGLPVAAYRGDGQSVFQQNLETDEWQDITESSKEMLDHASNYMNMLVLFRIDHNFRYSKRFYQSVEMKQLESGKQIDFTLRGKAISEMFSLSDERSIRREMASQVRTYRVNAAGDLDQIVIDSRQNVTYLGNSGTLTNVITVTISYED